LLEREEAGFFFLYLFVVRKNADDLVVVVVGIAGSVSRRVRERRWVLLLVERAGYTHTRHAATFQCTHADDVIVVKKQQTGMIKRWMDGKCL